MFCLMSIIFLNLTLLILMIESYIIAQYKETMSSVLRKLIIDCSGYFIDMKEFAQLPRELLVPILVQIYSKHGEEKINGILKANGDPLIINAFETAKSNGAADQRDDDRSESAIVQSVRELENRISSLEDTFKTATGDISALKLASSIKKLETKLKKQKQKVKGYFLKIEEKLDSNREEYSSVLDERFNGLVTKCKGTLRVRDDGKDDSPKRSASMEHFIDDFEDTSHMYSNEYHNSDAARDAPPDRCVSVESECKTGKDDRHVAFPKLEPNGRRVLQELYTTSPQQETVCSAPRLQDIPPRYLSGDVRSDIFQYILFDRLDLVKDSVEKDKGLVRTKASSVRHCYDGNTPVHCAVSSRRHSILSYLLSVDKSSVDLLDSSGHPPLQCAAGAGDLESVRILLGSGADTKIRDSNGCTCLHHAVRSGSVEVVRLLLENGADPNAANMYSNTPLHLAAHNDLGDICRLLITHRSDPKSNNSAGFTPADLTSAEDVKLILETKIQ